MDSATASNTAPDIGQTTPRPDSDVTQQIAQQIERLASLGSDDLRRVWAETYGKPPPPKTNREILLLGIAYRIQEKAFGGLSAATRRRLINLAGGADREGSDATAAAAQERLARMRATRVKPGTRLLREWKGETHQVNVLDQGFSWKGNAYRSLTEVAKAITGTKWNGWVFFGLKKPAATQSDQPETRP